MRSENWRVFKGLGCQEGVKIAAARIEATAEHDRRELASLGRSHESPIAEATFPRQGMNGYVLRSAHIVTVSPFPLFVWPL